PVDLIGVEGLDDIGMVELSGRQNLAAKPGARPLIFEQCRRDDLESHDSIHEHMPRLVNAPEAAFAEVLEQPILTEDKPPAMTAKEFGGLEFGEQSFVP